MDYRLVWPWITSTKTLLLTLLIGLNSSCSSQDHIVGAWKAIGEVIKLGEETVFLPFKGGDSRQAIWTFTSDGSLSFNTKPGGGEPNGTTLRYTLRNDTLTLTGAAGNISLAPILKLTSDELRIRHLSAGDSVVGVFSRVR